MSPMEEDPKTPVFITCARCGKPAPITGEELTGDGPGPSRAAMPVVVVPPEGWIGDPDGDGIVCGECAEPEEIAEWMAGLEQVESSLRKNPDDDA